MKNSKTQQCAQLLAIRPEITDEELCSATGIKAATMRRLRNDTGFLAEVNRRSKLRFVGELPRVLQALADAASDGKNASAMKLFIDTCSDYEADGGKADGDPAGVELMAKLLESMKEE